MNRQEAEILIWRVLDGEAAPAEEDALREICSRDPAIQELRERATREFRSLNKLAETHREALLSADTIEEALDRLSTRAEAEARTLGSLERTTSGSKRKEAKRSLGWERFFQPLPSFSGAVVGAAATLGILIPVTQGTFLATGDGISSESNLIVATTPWRTRGPLIAQEMSDSGGDPHKTADLATKQAVLAALPSSPEPGAERTEALRIALQRLSDLFNAQDPNYSAAAALIAAFQLSHPELLKTCSCDTFDFHTYVTIVERASGRFPKAGDAMVNAGKCLKLNPCAFSD